jgi:hypothetical protein
LRYWFRVLRTTTGACGPAFPLLADAAKRTLVTSTNPFVISTATFSTVNRLRAPRSALPVSCETTNASKLSERRLTRFYDRATLAIQNLVDNSISRSRPAAHRLDTSGLRASRFPRDIAIFLCADRPRVGQAALASIGGDGCHKSALPAEPSNPRSVSRNATCRPGGRRTL